MAWHHRPGDRVRLVYAKWASPYKGQEGAVLVRARGPKCKNFLVLLDSGVKVVVPGGNLRGSERRSP